MTQLTSRFLAPHSPLALHLLAGTFLLGLSGCSTSGTNSNHPDAQTGNVAGGHPIVVQASRMPVAAAPAKPEIAVLQAAIASHLQTLQAPDLPAFAYYLAYGLTQRHQLVLRSSHGALLEDDLSNHRQVDIDVRVGSPELDNTRVNDGGYDGIGIGAGLPITIDANETSLAQTLWQATEYQYKNAVEALQSAKDAEQMRADEAQSTDLDFSTQGQVSYLTEQPPVDLQLVRAQWIDVIAAVSAQLARGEARAQSEVHLVAAVENRIYVNSEGSQLQDSRILFSLSFEVALQAADGMELTRSRVFYANSAAELPSREQALQAATELLAELHALEKAPVAEPYTGPAILEGMAAGVFFHEIFGHRLEGHRQKDDSEGQTFAKMLGQPILPTFIEVWDDPTMQTLNGTPLNGYYAVDDEAVIARPVQLVREGKLQTFLLSRSPVAPFLHSNGHGRRAVGYPIVARQGNLMVTSNQAISSESLREALLAEIRRQKKPYGLRFAEIDGGYTTTTRDGPQAFKVEPKMVYRVYADGRPDELVRGADIVGTPLAAFSTILATGDELAVFNGMCGAESGWVPVSAIAPPILLGQLEIERAAHEREKPPLLSPPTMPVQTTAATTTQGVGQ